MLLLLFVDQLDLRYISVNPETSIGLSISFKNIVNLQTSIGLSISFQIYRALILRRLLYLSISFMINKR